MASILRFLQLPKTEKALLLKSLFLIVAVRTLLWLVPVRVVRWLSTSSVIEKEKTPDSESDWDEIANIVRAVRTASRLVPRATCLTQALAAWLLMRSSGQTSELKIGVAKDDLSMLIAHAWLEKDGRIILGELPDQYKLVPLRAYSV